MSRGRGRGGGLEPTGQFITLTQDRYLFHTGFIFGNGKKHRRGFRQKVFSNKTQESILRLYF